jgi:hypothetical protein
MMVKRTYKLLIKCERDMTRYHKDGARLYHKIYKIHKGMAFRSLPNAHPSFEARRGEGLSNKFRIDDS